VWRLLNSFREQLVVRLGHLYGEQRVDRLMDRLALIVGRYSFLGKACSVDGPHWDHRSALLITYGDMVRCPGQKPLKTLARFLDDFFSKNIPGFMSCHFSPPPLMMVSAL